MSRPTRRGYAELKPLLAELREKIAELRMLGDTDGAGPSEELEELERRQVELVSEVFADLTPWETVLIARHEKRPYTLDYAALILDDFVELHGDRRYGDDPAIVAGLGRLEGRNVAWIGHQKGRTAKDRRQRNFGMPHPEGYRKALRVMRLAERFGLPIITLLDTPGADCLSEAEARGISEAIADNQRQMFSLRTPIVVTIIGEGGSGGAIGIGVGDRVLMLQYAYYSVIAPESCASIIWRDGTRREEAASALKLTAADALSLGVVDEIVPEPPGAAHADPVAAAEALKSKLVANLDQLSQVSIPTLIEQRYQKFRRLGQAWTQGLED